LPVTCWSRNVLGTLFPAIDRVRESSRFAAHKLADA
jgi:hypothetical protein